MRPVIRWPTVSLTSSTGRRKVASVVANESGFFTVGLTNGGSYIVAAQTEGGEPVTAGKPVSSIGMRGRS